MKKTKEFRLYAHPRGCTDKRKCLLVHKHFMYIHDNMVDAVKEVYKDYLKDSDDPLINFLLVEIYTDGSEDVVQCGYIKPDGYYRYLCIFIEYSAPVNRDAFLDSIIDNEITIEDAAKIARCTRAKIYNELKAYKKLMGYNKEEV